MVSSTTTGSTRSRGVHRLWDPRVWGSVIGALGGTVFVFANRGNLPEPWPMVALFAWSAAMTGYLVAVFVVIRRFPAPVAVRRSAGLVYLASVVGMLVLIQIGRLLLGAEHAAVLPAVIVLAVGLHFLPFAAAFHAQVFALLGVVMVALGAAGILLGLTWSPIASAAIACVAGVSMMAIIAVDAVAR